MTADTAFKTLSKVPAVTLGFWIIKILATTLGETAGDTVSMSWLGETTEDAPTNFWAGGYLIGTLIFGAILAVLVTIQIKARSFNPALYWATIIASTTAGTTLADFATRSLGIGYTGGSALLLALVLISLVTWYRALGSISVDSINNAKSELYYWITITFSQTLGTALGDWTADTNDFGYLGGATIFTASLIILTALNYLTKISRVFLFWAAFIMTRPLGATVGDFLDKPVADGGLNFSRPIASLVLLVAIAALIYFLPQKAGGHPGSESE
jgi:uncharacterized membrane-anchored protein